MKLHRPIAQATLSALTQVFGENRHADKVLERLLKANRQFGARDRRWVAETVYDMTRWWRSLWAALGTEPSLEPAALWKLIGVYLILHGRGSELPAWPEFKGLDPVQIKSRAERYLQDPATRESVPDWLYEIGKGELGEKWDGYLRELNRPAPVILRANRLRVTREQLAAQLASEGIETLSVPSLPDGLILKERRNVFSTEAFKKGYFEVQDGASQQVAPLLDPQPGDRVIDACAGAGGKSLHLAALMKNKGKILSLDIHERKLEELRKRASRAGVDIIETRPIDSSKAIKRLENAADRLLLDVPCSGLGVLRRNPDTKWKLKADELENLRSLQTHLLDTYTKMLKPGGRLVYATCSVLPSENERQTQRFLSVHAGGFSLIEEKIFAPGADGFDGFYAAALVKT